MDNNREQSTSTVENKGSLISRKVWSIEENKSKVVNVNADGTIPMRIQMKMEKNKLIATDYTKDIGGEVKRLHIQKINNIIESKYI